MTMINNYTLNSEQFISSPNSLDFSSFHVKVPENQRGDHWVKKCKWNRFLCVIPQKKILIFVDVLESTDKWPKPPESLSFATFLSITSGKLNTLRIQ